MEYLAVALLGGGAMCRRLLSYLAILCAGAFSSIDTAEAKVLFEVPGQGTQLLPGATLNVGGDRKIGSGREEKDIGGGIQTIEGEWKKICDRALKLNMEGNELGGFKEGEPPCNFTKRDDRAARQPFFSDPKKGQGRAVSMFIEKKCAGRRFDIILTFKDDVNNPDAKIKLTGSVALMYRDTGSLERSGGNVEQIAVDVPKPEKKEGREEKVRLGRSDVVLLVAAEHENLGEPLKKPEGDKGKKSDWHFWDWQPLDYEIPEKLRDTATKRTVKLSLACGTHTDNLLVLWKNLKIEEEEKQPPAKSPEKTDPPKQTGRPAGPGGQTAPRQPSKRPPPEYTPGPTGRAPPPPPGTPAVDPRIFLAPIFRGGSWGRDRD